MKIQSFNSATVRSASYERNTETLTIYYADGREIGFFSVPPGVARIVFSIEDPAQLIKDFIEPVYAPLAVSWVSIFRRRKVGASNEAIAQVEKSYAWQT